MVLREPEPNQPTQSQEDNKSGTLYVLVHNFHHYYAPNKPLQVFHHFYWVAQMRKRLRICATQQLKRLRKCAIDCAFAQPTGLLKSDPNLGQNRKIGKSADYQINYEPLLVNSKLCPLAHLYYQTCSTTAKNPFVKSSHHYGDMTILVK